MKRRERLRERCLRVVCPALLPALRSSRGARHFGNVHPKHKHHPDIHAYKCVYTSCRSRHTHVPHTVTSTDTHMFKPDTHTILSAHVETHTHVRKHTDFLHQVGHPWSSWADRPRECVRRDPVSDPGPNPTHSGPSGNRDPDPGRHRRPDYPPVGACVGASPLPTGTSGTLPVEPGPRRRGRPQPVPTPATDSASTVGRTPSLVSRSSHHHAGTPVCRLTGDRGV